MNTRHPTAPTSLYYNGDWIPGNGPECRSLNPATTHLFWQGNSASPEQIEAAYASAQNASFSWATLPLENRLAYIEKAKVILKAHETQLATLISLETGKSLWETTLEAKGLLSKIDVSIQAYQERCPERLLTQGEKTVSYRHKPHGVLTVFGPFNFPAHLPNGHIIPALIAGNCVVFKPSEFTPAVGAYYMSLLAQAGFPPGVLSLIQGDRTVGQRLATHPQSQGLLFTGSATTGQLLSRLFAETPSKILALELGGNNPMVVSHCDDEKAAALTIALSAFITSGQRCTCARRLIMVESNQTQRLLNQVISIAQTLDIADPCQTPHPFYGTVIHEGAFKAGFQKATHLENLGATPLLPLKQALNTGYFLRPGIYDVTGINTPDEEYFGPILQVIRVKTIEEAIQCANATAYGLSASLISPSAQEFNTFYNYIKAGIINWNAPTTGASASAPFGGVGISGNHRPSAYYAADYCAYPVASTQQAHLTLPTLPPGFPSC